MSDDEYLYTVSEADMVERLTTIGTEIQVTRELIKDNIAEPQIEEEAFVDICEYYTTLYRLETLLFNIIDESHYDKKDSLYHISKKQRTYLIVFLRSLHTIKEALQGQNISLCLH